MPYQMHGGGAQQPQYFGAMPPGYASQQPQQYYVPQQFAVQQPAMQYSTNAALSPVSPPAPHGYPTTTAGSPISPVYPGQVNAADHSADAAPKAQLPWMTKFGQGVQHGSGGSEAELMQGSSFMMRTASSPSSQLASPDTIGASQPATTFSGMTRTVSSPAGRADIQHVQTLQQAKPSNTEQGGANADAIQTLIDTAIPDFWEEGADFSFSGELRTGDVVVIKRSDGTRRFAQIYNQLLGRPAAHSLALVLEHKRAFKSWNQMETHDESKILQQASNINKLQDVLLAKHPEPSRGPGASMLAKQLSGETDGSMDPNNWGDQFLISEDYAGPHLRWPLTLDNVEQVLEHIRRQPRQPLHPRYIAQLLGKGVELFAALPSCVAEMAVPDMAHGKVVVLGDTHGQLQDFLTILKDNGEPSPSIGYLLNGDMADRGEHAVEIIVIALLYKILFPAQVFMNRGNHELQDISRAYGFFDELQQRHHPALFVMFQSLFEVLPLATVLAGSVYVVHAGLPRFANVQINHIRGVRQRFLELPERSASFEDALLWDCLWADPMDSPGVSRNNNRGEHVISFGPDMTHNFLRTNGFSFVIRSHEVPRTNGGFEYRHDGRLITLFSASNYCGTIGNTGAVAVLDQSMMLSFREHMAPSLDDLVAYYTAKDGAAKEQAARRGRRQSTWEGMQKSLELMQEEVLAKLEARVIEHKDDLWLYWSKEDAGSGRVALGSWVEGMSEVLQLQDLHWESLQSRLVETDEAGEVDYVEFLQRNKPSVRSGALREGWESRVLHKVYEELLLRDWALAELLAKFDEGDGLVSPIEFREGLLAAELQLPEWQLNALLRAIETDAEGKLRVPDFFDRFQVVYSQGEAERGHQAPGATADLLTKVGRALVGNKSRVETFEQIDLNHDGYVDQSEFYTALSSLPGIDALTEAEMQELWEVVDLNHDGHLNYLEFCAGFQVVDSSLGSQQAATVDEFSSSLLGVLAHNRITLKYAFSYFDSYDDGLVSLADFKHALCALNASLQSPDGAMPFTDDQLQVVAEHVEADAEGMVDWRAFLEAFEGGGALLSSPSLAAANPAIDTPPTLHPPMI